jgi:digeranylgeranylglycerophospholipid reductase
MGLFIQIYAQHCRYTGQLPQLDTIPEPCTNWMNNHGPGSKPGYDVVIVGAGPVGSAAALACTECGLSTLCIEEHGTIGNPVQCAGLLSQNAFRECNVSRKSVLNEVSGAEVISQSGNRLLIDAGVSKAFVVDRGILDREMAERAAMAGAEFQLKTSVYQIAGQQLLTRGIKGHKKVSYKVLIAADGPRSTIARLRGVKRARLYLAGIQAEIKCESDPRFVGVYPDASPEFFAWRIPVNKNLARIGLAGRTRVKERFLSFARQFDGACMDFVLGTIPLGVMPVTYGGRTLYTGDAAGFAKPTSGGGIYTGIRTARHAAATAFHCIESQSFDDNSLSRYEQLWKQDIGKELELGLIMFRVRQTLGPVETDRLIRALRDPDVLEIIRKYGDMDRPARVIKELLKKPALYRQTDILLRSGIRLLTGL